MSIKQENNVRKSIAAQKKASILYADRLKVARSELTDCTHPESDRYTFRWEHDNGYGRQSWIDGEKCLLCEKQRMWKGSGSWDYPEWMKWMNK